MISIEKLEKLKELEQRLKDSGVVDVKFAKNLDGIELNKLADDMITVLEAMLDGKTVKRPDFYKLRDRNTVYIDGFNDRYDLSREFDVSLEELDDYDVLIAIYDLSEAYSGDAYVLLYNDGQFYEAHGSHCSCSGLEGQWELEEVPVESLRKRIVDNTYCYGAANLAKPYIKEILDLIA